MVQQTTSKRISISTLLNIILIAILAVIVIYGYFYIKKLNPTEVVKATVPTVNMPEYEFAFSIYGGELDFDDPYEVLAFEGRIYVSDYQNGRVAIYDSTGKHLQDINFDEMKTPAGMYWDGEILWVADAERGKVLMIDVEGNLIDSILIDEKAIIADVTVNNGYLYALDNNMMKIIKYNLNSHEIEKTFGQMGKEEGKLYYPYDLAINGNDLYVTDSLNNRINVYDLEGNFVKKYPGDGGKLYAPRGLAFDKDNRLYTAEGMGNSIVAFDDQGRVVIRVAEGEIINDEQTNIYLPTDVTFDNLGRLYVLEHAHKRVLVYKLK